MRKSLADLCYARIIGAAHNNHILVLEGFCQLYNFRNGNQLQLMAVDALPLVRDTAAFYLDARKMVHDNLAVHIYEMRIVRGQHTDQADPKWFLFHTNHLIVFLRSGIRHL